MNTPLHPAPPRTWVLWMVIIVLFSALVAVCVAVLKHKSGAGTADTILYAGGAFGATSGLCFAAVGAVASLRGRTPG
ncbi:hypothetical protein [Streptomyces cinereoruber]|uniref:hypothetical protein n=1 Tax=Streptomyces cinereoruber TaxID=67260 RepID=UPI003632E42E